MTDKPVIGQLGRADATKQTKVEIIGELLPAEWAEFVECLKKCTLRFRGKITVLETTYNVRIKSLEQPPKKP